MHEVLVVSDSKVLGEMSVAGPRVAAALIFINAASGMECLERTALVEARGLLKATDTA